MRVTFLILTSVLALATSAQAQDTAVAQLKGPVHTVLSEEFLGESGGATNPNGSSLDIYDHQGFQVELYRYQSDGSLEVHTILVRNGPRVLATRTTGVPPYENATVRNTFDAEGHTVAIETYDADGNLLKKEATDFVRNDAESTIVLTKANDVGKPEKVREVVETTDPVTGIHRQIAKVDGKLESDWLLRRDSGGKLVWDKITLADGSYTERELRPDGTTLQRRYWAPEKSTVSETVDTHGRITEVVRDPELSYCRARFSFDDEGRPASETTYDASGVILSKTTHEYRNDAHGNWIERETILWDTSSSPIKPKTALTTLRTINYY